MWNFNYLFADIPASNGSKHAFLRNHFANHDVGPMQVDVIGGKTIHAADLGGTIAVKILVDSDGISPESGGIVYTPILSLEHESGPTKQTEVPEKERIINLACFPEIEVSVE